MRQEKMNDGKEKVVLELAALRLAIEQATNGLRQILDIQTTHTTLLQAVLDAATAPVESDQELEDALARIQNALGEQTTILAKICKAVAEPTA